MDETVTLFHGTSERSAAALLTDGWAPRTDSYEGAGNGGRPGLFYLTDEPENAAWYAQQRGNGAVLRVHVPGVLLAVDPEDGIANTVAAELALLTPANLVCTGPVPSASFTPYTDD